MVKKHMMNLSGITLIELIIVISLIMIVVGILVPQVRTSSFSLLSQSRELCQDIRVIQYNRKTDGRAHRILLMEDQYKVLVGPKEIKVAKMKDGNRILTSGEEIMFNYNGVPINGGTTITVYNDNTMKNIKITIVPSSGRVLMNK